MEQQCADCGIELLEDQYDEYGENLCPWCSGEEDN